MIKIVFFLIVSISIINYNFLLYANEKENNKIYQISDSTNNSDISQRNESSKDTSSTDDSSTNNANKIIPSGNPTKIDIKVSNIIAKVNPQTEITLPTGSFSEHLKHSFNNLNIIFNFNYNFLANEISGNISFEYPLRYILPYLSFSDSVDFESYIQPSLVNNKIQLVPTDKFITRNRILEGGLKYKITKDFSTFTSITLDDIFRGDLFTSTIIENGLDITAKIGTEYNSMKIILPKSRLLFKGIYYKTSFDLKYRNNLETPVSINHNENLLITAKTGKNWYIDQNVSTGFPITIWENTLTSFYTLGGFESIRGYQEKSINAFRYISTSSTIHRRLSLKKEIKKKVLKNYYIHASIFDLYLFFDQCISQNQLPLNSPIQYYPSVGAGSSIIISGENKRHIRVSLFVAQAIKQGQKPIIYLKTSFFQFEK